METLNETTRPVPAHFCCAGIDVPNSAVKPKRATIQPPPLTTTRNAQKPWSIFGDVYWI